MTSVSAKRFNWIRSPAQWEKNQAWRERQQEARDNSEAANTSANSSFFGAGINMATGLGAIAATVARRRMQAQAIQAVLNKLA
jgi:hypothetical protein